MKYIPLKEDDRFSSSFSYVSLKASDIIVDKMVIQIKTPAENKVFRLENFDK